MLAGRLGLETARIPHADRHGLLWLSRGLLYVQDGTLRFRTAGDGDLRSGDYAIPHQMVSTIVLGPGSSVSHDAMRVLARHGTGLLAVGEGGIRFYASMPFGPDDSNIARRHALLWSDRNARQRVARRMYAWRFGQVLPDEDLNVLRGMEGARARETYRVTAQRFGLQWSGRRYDRSDPTSADSMNQAINHAASAVEGAAQLAVATVGAIPQLGFIHEESGNAFPLDIADLYRDAVTLPAAFGAVASLAKHPGAPLERAVRQRTGSLIREQEIVPAMIDKIKEIFLADDGDRHP